MSNKFTTDINIQFLNKLKLTSFSFSLATSLKRVDLSPPILKIDVFTFKYFPLPQPGTIINTDKSSYISLRVFVTCLLTDIADDRSGLEVL